MNDPVNDVLVDSLGLLAKVGGPIVPKLWADEEDDEQFGVVLNAIIPWETT